MTRLALIAAVVVAASAGCGGTTIDGGDLEDEIIEDAEREGLVVDAADCPSPDAEEGATFECTVTVKGQETQLEIEQRNDDGNVEYDLEPLVEGPAVNDTAADETSVRFVIEAINDDATALCDYATTKYRRVIARQTGAASCAKAVLGSQGDQIEDYEISVDGDTAAVVGTRTVALKRQPNGSWLITRLE